MMKIKTFTHTLLGFFYILLISCGQGDSNSPNTSLNTATITFIEMDIASELILPEGDEQQLTLTVELDTSEKITDVTSHVTSTKTDIDADVLWYSQDPEIATITSQGKLWALSPGTTLITATVDNHSAGLNVTVTENLPTATQVHFSQDILNITDNQIIELSFDVEFEGQYKLAELSLTETLTYLNCSPWFSTSETNAYVIYQDARLQPIQSGSGFIEFSCGDFWATLPVYIASHVVADTTAELEDIQSVSITIANDEYSEGATIPLTATIHFKSQTITGVSTEFLTPGGELKTLDWISSDKTLINITNGLATAKGQGELVLTAQIDGLYDKENLKLKMPTEDPEDVMERFLDSGDVYQENFASDADFGHNQFPQILYGLPQNTLLDVVSFGTGGELTIELKDFVIVDGPKEDFTIFENPQTGWTERAEVLVSEDGTNYVSFDCNAHDPTGTYAGCAGVNNITYSSNPYDLIDPKTSGGDSFDLEQVGLKTARYIKIIDKETCTPDGFICIPGTIGFDLDALAIVNGMKK